ncbi:MAG: pirin family protein [Deltaproteobacteria bacterium]|nr:pirin family protein [Deltaproteobacteria bacterium]
MPSRFVSRRQAVGSLAGAFSAAALASCARRLSPAPATVAERSVVQIVDAQPTVEGAGVRLRRSLGSRALPLLDPFLMLDEFHSDRPADYQAGFPSHPHRGFETVTYMLHGAMEHRDSLGNAGRLGPGSVQWMTAGRGIIHSEMPQQEQGLMWGFQLWVNLPAAHKMTRPRYQDLAADKVGKLMIDDARVRLVAGDAGGMRGPVAGIVTAPLMLDVSISAGGTFRHLLPAAHNAFAYVFEGTVQIGPSRMSAAAGQLAVLGGGDRVTIQATPDRGARLLCLAAAPIREPVARSGPFVMNSEAELRQAVEDYRSGNLVAPPI